MIKLDGLSNLAALVGRLFFSSLFILSGYAKLTAFTGTIGYMGKQGLPAPIVFAALAVIFELGGGLLMAIGYQTRLVALALAVFVFVAAMIAHRDWALAGQYVQFMKNMAIVGGALAFVAAGAGKYSLDGDRA